MNIPKVNGVRNITIMRVLEKMILFCSKIIPQTIISEGFLIIAIRGGENKKYTELLARRIEEHKVKNQTTDYALKARQNLELLIEKNTISSRAVNNASAAGAIVAENIMISVSTNANPDINEALALLLALTLKWLHYEKTGEIIDVLLNTNN